MKKIFYLMLGLATITACKKEDNKSLAGPIGGEQITSATVLASVSAGKVASNYRLDSNVIKIPVADTNIFLNYSSVNTSNSYTDSFKAPNNSTTYATATYMRGVTQNVLGNNIAFNNFFRVNSTSWVNLGSYTPNSVNIPIPTVGSITVPSQAPVNNPSQILVNFPIAYGDSIAQTSTNVINTLVTANYSGFVLNNETLSLTTQTTVASKNIAWGKMRIAGYTDTSDIIIQRYTTKVKLTFSFTGPSAPLYNLSLNSILQPYGITNGQETTLTEYRYWAKNKGLIMTLQSNGVALVRTDL
jgi:hypothetical protein